MEIESMSHTRSTITVIWRLQERDEAFLNLNASLSCLKVWLPPAMSRSSAKVPPWHGRLPGVYPAQKGVNRIQRDFWIILHLLEVSRGLGRY